MPTYNPILDADIDAGQPLTKSLIEKLRDNPLALISAVPTELTSSGTYGVPTGVTLLMVICVGGGGSGSRSGVVGGTSGCVKCGFVTTTGGASISYSIGAGGAASNGAGNNGGDTTFDGSITGKGGFGGDVTRDYRFGPFNDSGEQKFITGGVGGSGYGGGAAGVPWFLRTSSLGNGGGTNSNATGRGAGGGGGLGTISGAGSGGIIFVLPLQA